MKPGKIVFVPIGLLAACALTGQVHNLTRSLTSDPHLNQQLGLLLEAIMNILVTFLTNLFQS